MIRKEKGEFVAECNECGTETYGGCAEDFREFTQQIKKEGWALQKDMGEWVHLCPDCKTLQLQ